MSLKIEAEFKNLCPKLKTNEYSKLEKSIQEEGCRDPLVVWDNIILDGHNRYEICTKYEIRFDTVPAPEWVKTRQDAVNWIIDNQLGRRNLTVEQRNYLIGKKYKEQKKPQGGTGANQHTKEQSGQNVHQAKTAQKVAEEEKINEKTVRRAEKFTEAVDRLAETVGEEAKNKILAREINITQKDVKRLAGEAPEEQKKVIDMVAGGEAKSYVDARRLIRKKETASVSFPEEEKKYRVLYADPPWRYNDRRDGNTTGAEDHYPTMTITELCDLSIKRLAQDNAVLFLWTTSPLLEDSFKVINAWGFKYKTSFVWDKVKHNMGHYNSVRHELLLVCTRGSCTPDNAKLFDSVQEIERNDKHSEKPERFREIIDTLYTHGPKIELFARKSVKGWDVWGAEVETA